MTTTSNKIPAIVVTEAKFVGYLEVDGPQIFTVPIRAFKPLNPYPMTVSVAWVGDKDATFEFGGIYRIAVDTRNYQTGEASAV